MTPEERRIYDRMSDDDRRRVDALRPEMRGLSLALWDRLQAKRARRRARSGPPDAWKTAPRRETVAPKEFEDDSERRFP